MHFDSYEALSIYPDCKYAIDVNDALTRLVIRVESLNMAGEILWPNNLPENFGSFPVSRYDWLTIAADVFLMRYISVVDCSLLLVNELLEFQLDRHACSLRNLRAKGLPSRIDHILTEIVQDQGSLRFERNARFHHGEERAFTDDDTTFRTVAMFEHWSKAMTGTDRFGRKINIDRMLKEGLVELQREFNNSTRVLVRHLNRLYDELQGEFESRFGPRIAAATHGLNRGRVRGGLS